MEKVIKTVSIKISVKLDGSRRDVDDVIADLMKTIGVNGNFKIDADVKEYRKDKDVPKAPGPVRERHTHELTKLLSCVSLKTKQAAAEIIGPSRKAGLVEARQVFVWLARTIGHCTWQEIGKYLNRDHSTMMHGARKLGQYLTYDKKLADLIQNIKEEWKKLWTIKPN